MTNGEEVTKIAAIVLLILFVLFGSPLLLILSINGLFGLENEYTLKNFLYAFLFLVAIRARVNNKDN